MQRTIPTYDLYGESHGKRPDFWLHCETIAARSSAHRWEIGLHRHESFQQFLYIRNGAGDAVLGAVTLPLSPPCVVAVPPGVSHGFRFSRDVDGLVITLVAERWRLTAGPGRQSGDWLSAARLVTLGEGEDARYLDETFARLLAEFEARRAGRSDLTEAYLDAAILLVGRLVGSQDNKMGQGEREGEGNADHARVQALKDLVGRHFRDRWPAEAYAGALHLSPAHLNRIVRKVAGMSTHDLIMARVVDEARRALVFTPSTVQQVADSLGFADAAYFSRLFRRRTGMTPRHYREAERQRLRQAGDPA